MDKEKEDRDLTVPEGIVKVSLAAIAAYLMKTLVEKSVESGFRKYRHTD